VCTSEICFVAGFVVVLVTGNIVAVTGNIVAVTGNKFGGLFVDFLLIVGPWQIRILLGHDCLGCTITVAEKGRTTIGDGCGAFHDAVIAMAVLGTKHATAKPGRCRASRNRTLGTTKPTLLYGLEAGTLERTFSVTGNFQGRAVKTHIHETEGHFGQIQMYKDQIVACGQVKKNTRNDSAKL
jgi:hypothetical protein